MDYKFDNDTGDFLLKIVGAILIFFSFRWLKNMFAGKDGKLDITEFKKMVAFVLFIWAFIYVLITEGKRPSGTEHIYSELWVFFIISALLTVLHLDSVLDKMSNLLEMLARLRSKTTFTQTEETKKETTTTAP